MLLSHVRLPANLDAVPMDSIEDAISLGALELAMVADFVQWTLARTYTTTWQDQWHILDAYTSRHVHDHKPL